VVFGRGRNPSHAGIYVGEGRFVHAPSTGGEVRMDHLESKYWAKQNASFRRP
jgi:cell wall-associated NlpC family hydrolase